MIVVYDKKLLRVITSLVANQLYGDSIPDLLVKMFPDRHRSLGCVEIGAFSGDPVGCSVELVDGMICGISRDGDDLYRVDPEELKRIAQAKRDEQRGKLVRSFPFKKNAALESLLFKTVPSLRQTLPETIEAINDNSYFGRNTIPVGWWGSFLDAGGYANMNREIVQRLHNYNIIPYVSIYPTISQVSPDTQRTLKTYSRLKPKSHNHPYVYAFTPMPHERHPGRRIFFTMMETSSLHPDFVKYCNLYSDEVWVPSVANHDLFASNGITKPIHVVPLGIDELLYFPKDDAPIDFPLENSVGIFGRDPSDGINTFKFLTVIQWNMRKGYDAMIQAYVNAFDSSDDVCLVISTQYSKDIVLSTLEPFMPRGTNLPQVILYNSIIPISMMPGIYDVCDCYIHMSRGEGFSLTQIEAAASGLPVISCRHSGMTEYLSDDNSFPIECPQTEPCAPALSQISYFYQNQTLWKVGPQQIDQAMVHMRTVYDDYPAALEKAKILQDAARTEYTWKRTAERVAEVLVL